MQVVIHNVTINVDGFSFSASADALRAFLNDAAVPAAHTDVPAATNDNVIHSVFDVDEGDAIHWAGQRFTFDGVVANDSKVRDPDADAVLFVRRADTGKLVSLTQEDLDRGGLTRRNG